MTSWAMVNFRFFDPISGICPNDYELSEEINIAAIRARKILENKSKEQISTLIEIIDFIIEEERETVFERLAEKVESNFDQEALDNEVGHSTNELLNLTQRYNLRSLTNDQEVRWEEVFAIFALHEIAECCIDMEWLKNESSDDYSEKELSELALQNYYIFNAYHHLTAAQKISTGKYAFSSSYTPTLQEILTRRAQKAAQKRHAPVNQIKGDLCEWYVRNLSKDLFKGQADAVRKFLEELPPEKKKLLAPTNAERTLKDALSKYLANKHT